MVVKPSKRICRKIWILNEKIFGLGLDSESKCEESGRGPDVAQQENFAV